MSKALIVLLGLLSIFALLTGCTQTPAASNGAPTKAPGSGYPAPTDNANNPAGSTKSANYPAPSGPTSNTPGAGSGYPAPTTNTGTSSIQVVASDGSTKTVSMADLNDLPKATVGGDSGPKLIDVLNFVNIFDFSSLTITGSNGTKDLTKDQVNDQVILGLANNTYSLIVNGQPAIKDVTAIKIK